MSTYSTIPYQSAQPELVRLRRLFHQYPEPSGQEYCTSQMVFDYPTDLGLKPKRITETRVVAMVWGKDARITSELYLSGDSAAYYFDHAKGIFMVFTAHMEDRENHPLHSAHFDMDEEVFWKTLATLHQFILEL